MTDHNGSAFAMKTNFSYACFSLLGFWPLALIAIIYANKAKTLQGSQDKAGARQAAASARRFATASWAVAALIFFIYLGQV